MRRLGVVPTTLQMYVSEIHQRLEEGKDTVKTETCEEKCAKKFN